MGYLNLPGTELAKELQGDVSHVLLEIRHRDEAGRALAGLRVVRVELDLGVAQERGLGAQMAQVVGILVHARHLAIRARARPRFTRAERRRDGWVEGGRRLRHIARHAHLLSELVHVATTQQPFGESSQDAAIVAAAACSAG